MIHKKIRIRESIGDHGIGMGLKSKSITNMSSKIGKAHKFNTWMNLGGNTTGSGEGHGKT